MPPGEPGVRPTPASRPRPASAWDPQGFCWASPASGFLVPPPPCTGGHAPATPCPTGRTVGVPCGQLAAPTFAQPLSSAGRRRAHFLTVQSPMHFPSFLEAPPHALLVPGGWEHMAAPSLDLLWWPLTRLVHQSHGLGCARRNAPPSGIWRDWTLQSLPPPLPSPNSLNCLPPPVPCPLSPSSPVHRPAPPGFPVSIPGPYPAAFHFLLLLGGGGTLTALLSRYGDPTDLHLRPLAPPLLLPASIPT